jgi:hypothetical protein
MQQTDSQHGGVTSGRELTFPMPDTSLQALLDRLTEVPR